MKVNVNHNLGQNEALERVKKLISQLKNQHQDKISDAVEMWDDNQGDFKLKILNIAISGKTIVTNTDVTVSGDLPLIARPFGSQIENLIKQNLLQLLA